MMVREVGEEMAKNKKQNYYVGDVLLSRGAQIRIVAVEEGAVSWTYDAVNLLTKEEEWFYESEAEGVVVNLEVITPSIERLFSMGN